ncbi:MAG: hypothetical protein HGA51_07130 [Demequinaceae bacterium]|nr:hypothetical protein [Demequinaceae bacterium]
MRIEVSETLSDFWAWATTPGGLTTGLVLLIIGAVCAGLWKRQHLQRAARWLTPRAHRARMVAKYGGMSTETLSPAPPTWTHPARFEVDAYERDGETATFLVNVGKGAAVHVEVTADSPFNGVRVRGAASWDRIGPGQKKRIELRRESAGEAYMYVDVTWADELGRNFNVEARLTLAAEQLLDPYRLI